MIWQGSLTELDNRFALFNPGGRKCFSSDPSRVLPRVDAGNKNPGSHKCSEVCTKKLRHKEISHNTIIPSSQGSGHNSSEVIPRSGALFLWSLLCRSLENKRGDLICFIKKREIENV